MLSPVLQDLCPRCGAESAGSDCPCVDCGYDPTDPGARNDRDPGRDAVRRRFISLMLLALTIVGLVILAFSAGWHLARPEMVADGTESSRVADAPGSRSRPSVGRVLFAERLGDSLELEAYRSQFRRGDTIAWRAELLEPPGTDEITVVIAWQSIRETMQLSRSALPVRDVVLTVIASDEVPLDELVPTAGMYSVSYWAEDRKLAEGVFELLPPDR